ncbi:aspartate aminotransferase family protein, partial [Candidatus Woesearchaeota archaeon]|nr:aspartate aminotransferase family protein [Candidatus Woesearchaeota archaeon]
MKTKTDNILNFIAKEVEEKYLVPTYARRELTFVRGEGVYLYDDHNKRYLDMMSNYGVSIVGHANSQVNLAINAQLARLSNLHTSFYHEQRAKLAQKLVEITPRSLQKVYFGNSGAESVEAAIKFAWAATGKRQIVSAKMGYHGKTIAALSATTSNPAYRKPFLPLLPNFLQCSYNDEESLKNTITQDTAAVILEPIQGESGIQPATNSYLRAARDICDDKAAVLILDEVQTGFRTGSWTASEHYHIEPDIICLAKPLANGLPIGATLLSEDVAVKLDKGMHTCTFGGSPVVCAAALATIDYIESNKLLEHSSKLGKYIMEKLKAIDSPLIREVRGLGLMIGIDLKRKNSQYLKTLQEKGVIALPAASTVIRFLPPLIIQKEHADTAV